MQGGNALPLTYLLQTHNAPKVPQKPDADERALMDPGEIREVKSTNHDSARNGAKSRNEFIRARQDDAAHPEPVVPTLSPDPPVAPTMDALDTQFRCAAPVPFHRCALPPGQHRTSYRAALECRSSFVVHRFDV